MKAIKEKLPDTREEWLAQRARGLGGSDAGAVMGVNKYKSAYTLWAEKTGILPAPDIDNEAMRQGRDLENYVAQRFVEETGKRVKRSNFCYTAIDHPHMRANIDRLIVGENAALECKTANLFTQDDYQAGVIPDTYYCQCLHYMSVLDLDRVYLAVLVLSRDFHIFEIDRSDPNVAADMAALVAAEKAFWTLVQTNTPPAIDGSESTAETIKLVTGASNPGTVPVNLEDLEALLEIREEYIQRLKDLEAEKTKIENVIKGRMDRASRATTSKYNITYKSNVCVDEARLKADLPDIYELCVTRKIRETVDRKKLEKAIVDAEKYLIPSATRPLKITRKRES